MSVDVDPVEDRSKWNDYVERSPQATPFHHAGALSVLAEYADADLTLLAGYKGQEPVGLFPAFERSVGPFSGVFSPPPGLRVPYLGPAGLNLAKLKARKAERRRRRFLEGCLEWLAEEVGPRYLHCYTSPAVTDARPLKDDGCTLTPRYTYVVDLQRDREELIMAFSSDARSNARTDPEELTISVGDRVDAERIVDQVARRYAEQGIDYELGPAFVADLYERLPEGWVRPYVCRVEGEFAGGILALADDRRVYRWQGGVKGADAEYPVNDLLDWAVMTDALEEGLVGYDLVGAENARINRYKSKFAPELRSYYRVERGTALTSAVASLYGRIK